MWNDAYLESRVLSADPLELVRLLYRHAIESVQASRRYLKAGDVAARSKAVCRAIDAVSELSGSLDHSTGGEISQNLAELYQYIRRRLTDGNLRRQDGPLAEAESLLTTLLEAWKPHQPEPHTEKIPALCPAPPAGAWHDTASAGAHVWSA
jgi:flagellar secretion chaperone FliS